MADRTYASLVPRVQASVPGCPNATIVQYVRDAAVRTCERTLAWRYTQPKFSLIPGVPEYPYQRPAGTDVHAVFLATVNGTPLEVLTLDAATRLYPQWVDLYSGLSPQEVWASQVPSTFNADPLNVQQFNAQQAAVTLPDAALADCAEPRSIAQVSVGKFVVFPAPDAAREYVMRMIYALKPTRNSSGMNEDVFNELEDCIFHATLQHLLVLPNVAWSDRELAAYHAKQYLFQLSERRARANLGNHRGVLSARMVRFE